MRNKGVFNLLAMAFLIPVGRLSAESTAFKTYISSSIGISVDYPADWFVDESPLKHLNFSNVREVAEVSDESIAAEALFHVNRRVNANPKKLPLTQWLDDLAKHADPPGSNRSAGIMGGRPAERIETAGMGRDARYFVADGVDVIEVVYRIDQPRFHAVYRRMVNSISFRPPERTEDREIVVIFAAASKENLRRIGELAKETGAVDPLTEIRRASPSVLIPDYARRLFILRYPTNDRKTLDQIAERLNRYPEVQSASRSETYFNSIDRPTGIFD
jgi:hypothetical protein